MYQIMCDSNILYDLRTEDRKLINPKLTLEVNKTGSLTFIQPSSNTVKINKLKSIIEVYQNGVLLFTGRAITIEEDFRKNKKVTCEGELAYLLDSIQRPYSFKNASVRDVLKALLDNHNKMVKDDIKQFEIGNITVIDSTGSIDSVYRSSTDYSKTWNVIQEKLIDQLGGHLEVRRGENAKYLDYLADFTHINTQTIEFRKNLLDITQFIDATSVITALIPLGKKLEDNTYITIDSVNGVDYVYSETAVKLYGWIWGIKQWEEVTLPSNLLHKANSYIGECIKEALSLELTAVDLSILDVNIENFKIGDKVRVISQPHKLDMYFVVNKLELNLESPENSKLQLGDSIKGLTDKAVESKKSANSNIDKIVTQENNNAKNIETLSETTNNTKEELSNQKKFLIMGVL